MHPGQRPVLAVGFTAAHPASMLAAQKCLRGVLQLNKGQGWPGQALLQLLDACYTSSSRSASTSALDGHLTACLADSRAIVELSGPDTIPFLQGLVTNDMRPLEIPGAAPVYAAFLTPKGKFLHDVIFYQQPGGQLLMEVDKQGIDRAYDWLTRHKLRKKIDIYDVSDEYAVWTMFGRKAPLSLQGWWTDPRLPALGLRSIQPRSANASQGTDASTLAGQGAHVSEDPATATATAAATAADMASSRTAASTSSSTLGTGHSSSTAEQYQEWRYMHGVAEGETEIPTEKAAPLDYNLDVLQGVSYKKGCYIGQERNSFTHYRGVIRKRCMPFAIISAGLPVAGEAILVPGSNEVAGSVQGAAGMHGLGYLKLKPALQAAAGQLELECADSKARVVPFRPEWWPDVWGKEEELEAAAAA